MAMLIPFAGPYDLRGTLLGGQAFRWRDEGDGWFCGVIFGNVVQDAKGRRRDRVHCERADDEKLRSLRS